MESNLYFVSMKASDMSLNEIVKVTGMTEEEIAGL